MATPETRSVELGPLAPSLDGDPNAAESEASQVVKPDTRELSAYGFDSDDKTLTGIGTSGAADPSAVGHVDSSDPTLVGIGPIECAKPAESASHSQQAEPALEGVPHSEPPGPFVAEGDIENAQHRLPKQKGTPSLLGLSTALLAAAAVALVRGGVPHSAAPHLHSATTFAPLPMATPTRTRSVQVETVSCDFGRHHFGRDPQYAGSAACVPAGSSNSDSSAARDAVRARASARDDEICRQRAARGSGRHRESNYGLGPRWSSARQGAARS